MIGHPTLYLIIPNFAHNSCLSV